MYTLSVPIYHSSIKRPGRDQILKELKKLNVDRIFLALDTYLLDTNKQKLLFDDISDNCRFFKKHGFEVGAWIWAFTLNNNSSFRNMRSINGSEIREFMCPTDESFVKFATEYIKNIARCGVDIIQFDDDLRFGFLSDSPACLCDRHIALINEMTGENSTREELKHHITSGGKNKFRDAFIKVNGDALRNFVSAARAAVNEVDPSIRMSLCTCMSSWDLDGTTPQELSKIIAGNTRPMLRLNGAPYWAVNKAWGNSLQDVIELERMESAWTRNEEIEIMAEGDAYPRPRTTCPASYVEGFDTAIRASGCTDGILKYIIDYFSNPDYETGYSVLHQRNAGIYKDIDRLFGSKTSVGVRVYESMKKISDMVMPTRVNSEIDLEHMFFSKAARMLAYNTIPTVYEGEGVCGIVFDENARNLPLDALKNGLILDIAAAEILSERGVDVGIEHIGEKTSCEFERFVENENHILSFGSVIYNIRTKSGAEILSFFDTPNGSIPASYRYENADGNRFLVLNINTRSRKDNLLKHYARSKQIANVIPWLSGHYLPAYSYGNPALYIQCKKNEEGMAVGLWNFFADPALNPTVQLEQEFDSISCIGCDGRLDGSLVILSEIPPFGFAAFEVKSKK